MSFSFSAISMVVNINEDKVVEGEGIHGEKHPQSGFVRLSLVSSFFVNIITSTASCCVQ